MRQLIPAGEAKPVAPLGVILGQYYLNLADFCKDFNSKTQHWEPGIKLSVIVTKALRAKEYSLRIKTPPISELITLAAESDIKINIITIFDIIKVYAKLTKRSYYSVANMVFATLKTTHRKKIIL